MKHVYYIFLLLSISSFSQTIAITEMLVNPFNIESEGEWIELYNYGSTSVNLKDWKLKDEDTDNAIISSIDLIVNPGDFIILAKNKVAFQNNWLKGCVEPRVIEVIYTLDDDSDEIIIENETQNVIWSIAYDNDDTEGFSTHYTEETYSNINFGSKEVPGINRAGNDVIGSLGYEKNNATLDGKAFLSINGDTANPLHIDYNRGNALVLDGSDDYLNLGNTIELENHTAFTFETWIKPITIDQNSERIFSKRVNNSNRIEIMLGNGGTESTNQFLRISFSNGTSETVDSQNLTVPVNKWTHIAVIFDGTASFGNRLKFYANGILQSLSSDVIATTTPSGNINTHIGNRSDNSNKPSNIELDEVRLWRTPRTAQDIRENMHLTLSTCEFGLEYYYQLNENNGAIISDYSNSNNAILNGGNLISSNINIGNSSLSNSQTIIGVSSVGIQDFSNALFNIDYSLKSEEEDITVTYSNFTPNTTSGTQGAISLLNQHIWTLNTSSSTGTYSGNITFKVPENFINQSLTPGDYTVFNRNMDATGDWTPIATGSSMTSNSLTFSGLTVKGQFLLAQTSDSTLSLNEERFNESYPLMYPNPLKSDKLYLNFLSSDPISNITVYDIKGVKLMTLNSEINNESYSFKLNESLETGIYLIYIEINSKLITKKLIVD